MGLISYLFKDLAWIFRHFNLSNKHNIIGRSECKILFDEVLLMFLENKNFWDTVWPDILDEYVEFFNEGLNNYPGYEFLTKHSKNIEIR